MSLNISYRNIICYSWCLMNGILILNFIAFAIIFIKRLMMTNYIVLKRFIFIYFNLYFIMAVIDSLVKKFVNVSNNYDTITISLVNECNRFNRITLNKNIINKDMALCLVDINEKSLERLFESYIDELKSRLNRDIQEIKTFQKKLEQLIEGKKGIESNYEL